MYQQSNKPTIKAKAKPSEKMFSCGAARVITPNDKLIVSSAIMPDNDILSAVLNMMPSQLAISRKSTALSEPDPIGKVLKLNTTNCSIFKCPSVARKNMVAKNINS